MKKKSVTKTLKKFIQRRQQRDLLQTMGLIEFRKEWNDKRMGKVVNFVIETSVSSYCFDGLISRNNVCESCGGKHVWVFRRRNFWQSLTRIIPTSYRESYVRGVKRLQTTAEDEALGTALSLYG